MTETDDSRLEREPHVLYKMYDEERRLLYTGITCRLGKRIANHLHTKPWFNQIAYIAVSHYPTRTAALEAERRAIVTERPLHNVAHGGSDRDPFRGSPRHILRLAEVPPQAALPPTSVMFSSSRYGCEMQLDVGQPVLHASFGLGKVKQVRGRGDSAQAEVEFPTVGCAKWLLLRYAPLELLA